jgi:hypothetical protein
MTTLVPAELVGKALEIYDLESSLGNPTAMRAALSSILSDWEAQVTHRIKDAALAFSDRLQSDSAASGDGRLAVQAFAYELESYSEKINNPYVPHTDDIVRVTLTGLVTEYEEECPHCDQLHDSNWSVTDSHSGKEYFFDRRGTGKLDIRVLAEDSVIV